MDGYVHEACLYGSDDELLDVVVPFLDEGRRAGEATLVNLGRHTSQLVRDALGDPGDVVWVADADRYPTPAAAIKQHLGLFDEMLSAGAPRIRAVGEIPQPAADSPWEPWARYEAAVNRAFAHLPLWGICVYDRRSTSAEVLEDVRCTHPRIATRDGRHDPNDGFEDPATWLAERPSPPGHPIEGTAPALELRDPWPHEARQAVEPLAAHLPPTVTHALATAVSEVVANARTHGEPPTLVRAWSGHDRVVVRVCDHGPGPDDPFAGLIPPERGLGDGGLGLWIAHQLCSDITLTRGDPGFCTRVVARTPVSS